MPNFSFRHRTVTFDLWELMPRRRWWPVIQPGLGPVTCLKVKKTHSDRTSRTCCWWISLSVLCYFFILYVFFYFTTRVVIDHVARGHTGTWNIWPDSTDRICRRTTYFILCGSDCVFCDVTADLDHRYVVSYGRHLSVVSLWSFDTELYSTVALLLPISLPLCLEWYNGSITSGVHSSVTKRIQCWLH